MLEGFPIYDAEMIDGKFAHGTNHISLVKKPAVQQPVFLFAEQNEGQQILLQDTFRFAAADRQRALIESVLMVADKPIKRKVDGKTFWLRFPSALVEKMAFKFMKNQFGKNINLEHDANKPVHEAYLVESYIFDPSRGRVLPKHMNADEVNPGSWIVTLKVDDEEIIQKIEDGEIVGYSLEGDFGIKVNFSESFAGIEKSYILDANNSVEDKFKHIQKAVENVKN